MLGKTLVSSNKKHVCSATLEHSRQRTLEHPEQRTIPFPEQPDGRNATLVTGFTLLGRILVCLYVDWLIRLTAGSRGRASAQRYFRHWFRGLGYSLVCLYVNRENTVDKYRRKKAPLRGHAGKNRESTDEKKPPCGGFLEGERLHGAEST